MHNIKKIILIFIGFLIISGLAWVGNFGWDNLRGIGPALKAPSDDISEIIKQNNTDFPLILPNGFSMDIFSENLPNARVIKQDVLGNFWISQTKEGLVTLLENKDGKIINSVSIFKNLNKPHGLAFDPKNPLILYIAEEDKISRVRLYSESAMEKIIDLPSGGRHFTRTINFGSDGRLYVSIGSSCDTCEENDERRASIYSMRKDGSDFRKYADGLRNAVFFTWNNITNKIWATEMGRDYLGDNLPPDEINIIEEDKFYGWPWYYGKNVRDKKFQSRTSLSLGRELAESYIDIQAHSSPLGLDFIPPNSKWPRDYWYDLLVAYHGSWNRTEPTGYKIVRFKFDEEGNYLGEEDFISGWLQDDGALGRPVDILVMADGVVYITDDHAGLVYKVSYIDR